MFTHSYTGTFIADNQHNQKLEKELQDEMQEIADWAGYFEGIGGETFEKGIKRQIEALNTKHKGTSRRYEAYYIDKLKEARIQVIEYKKEPNPNNDRLYIPHTIGDYTILRKT